MTALRQLHQQLESEVQQRDRFFATNEAFHMMLLGVARNRWREQIVQDLRKVMKLNRHHSLFAQGRIEKSLAEHSALMAALEARDGPQAAQLMRAHFDNGLAAAGS
jgi:DNA-binding GntR family transcriptional regulator